MFQLDAVDAERALTRKNHLFLAFDMALGMKFWSWCLTLALSSRHFLTHMV